jgi:hypothetical protein
MTRRVALAGLLALAIATPAQATFVVFTSQASYLAALAPNPFKDTYNDLSLGGVATPLNRSGNGFSYLASGTKRALCGRDHRGHMAEHQREYRLHRLQAQQ